MATLVARIGDLITAIGTDIKTIRTYVTGSASGNITALATTDKSSLVAAINEVRTTALADVTPDSTTAVKGKTMYATDVKALAMADTASALTPSNLAAITNVANGIAKLDGTGKVAAAQLPAYVDDVLEYANQAAFPASGTTGVMYVDLSTNKVYRWGGSSYVEISGSPGSTDAVPEGSVNLYYTNARADGRADARITALIGNPDTDLAAAYATAKA
jgi:hypothetical protein